MKLKVVNLFVIYYLTLKIMRNLAKIFTGGILAVLILALAMPAQAFSLEISPKILKNWTAVTGKILPQVLGAKLLAQEGTVGEVPPINPEQPKQPIEPQQPIGDQQPQPQPQPQPYQPTQDNQNNPQGNTCLVNGKEMPGDCSQYNNNNNQNNQNQNQNQQGEMNGQQGQQGGPSPEQQARQLKDMQRGVKQMKTQLDRLERNFTAAEKKGITISAEVKEKLAKAKEILAQCENAKSGEDLQDIDMGELGDIINELNQAQQEQVQQAQQLQNVKRDMKNLTNGIKQFETRIKQLEKQKMVVPVEVKNTIAKIKSIVAVVNAAKTWDEAEAAGLEDIQDLMSSLQESQQLMDMLSRWPQTLKQMNNELKNLNSALKRDTSAVKKLNAKGIDLSENLAAFKDSIAKLTAIRDEAAVQIKTGTIEGVEAAFDNLQENFFGSMEEIWAPDKTINMMGNLAQFQAQSKQGLAQVQAMINKLDKQKKDTVGLKEILAQTKTKMAAVLALIKAKPLDAEAVMDGLDELESLRSEFDNAYGEVVGEENNMPWEGNGKPGQFQNIQFNFNPGNYVQQKPQQTQPMNQNGGGPGETGQPMNGGNSGGGQQMAPGTL